MAPLERAMVVSYRLSIVTIALSVTIRPQFAIEQGSSERSERSVRFNPNLRSELVRYFSEHETYFQALKRSISL